MSSSTLLVYRSFEAGTYGGKLTGQESIIAENVGKASVIPRKTFDVLQTFGLPAKVDKDLTLGAPATVVRKATLDIVKSLEDGKAGDSKEARYMITGERGAGKSMLLLQAVAYALESGWIVFYQPTATRWVDSSTQFAYNEKKMMFDQPEAAVDMLQKLLAVNRKRLSQIKLESAVELADATVKAGEGLDKLVEHGLKEDTKTAIATLDAVLDILSNQTQFPVLFAIDEVQALFRTSKYRRPDYKFLEAYHLGVPRMALEYLSGARELKRGAVLTATALSHTEYMPSDSLIAGLGLPPRRTMHAYTPIDETYLNYAKSGIKRFDVPFGMTGPEAAAMFQLFARKGWTSNSECLMSGVFVSDVWGFEFHYSRSQSAALQGARYLRSCLGHGLSHGLASRLSRALLGISGRHDLSATRPVSLG